MTVRPMETPPEGGVFRLQAFFDRHRFVNGQAPPGIGDNYSWPTTRTRTDLMVPASAVRLARQSYF